MAVIYTKPQLKIEDEEGDALLAHLSADLTVLGIRDHRGRYLAVVLSEIDRLTLVEFLSRDPRCCFNRCNGDVNHSPGCTAS